jgi:hypothetical protein
MPPARLPGPQRDLRIADRHRGHPAADHEPFLRDNHRSANKVKGGQTTIEEVLRVTQIEEHLDVLAEGANKLLRTQS